MKKVLLYFLILFSFLGFAQGETDSVEIQAFQISNLTTAAEETDVAIKQINNQINNNGSLGVLLNDFETIKKNSESLKKDTAQEVLKEYNLWALNDYLNKWERYEKQIENIKADIKDLSVEYQEALLKAENYETRWVKTQDVYKNTNIPEALDTRMENVILSLHNTSSQIKDSLAVVLDKFDEVSSEYRLTTETIQKIKSLSNNKKLNVFSKDAKPLFKDIKERKEAINLTDQFSNIWVNTFKDTKDFLKENKEKFETHVVIALLFILLFFYIQYFYRKTKEAKDQSLKSAHYLINKPLRVSMVFILLVSLWVYPNAPGFIRQLNLLLLLIPILLLLPGIIDHKYKRVVYLIAALYLINQIESFMPMYPITQRVLILVQSVLAALGFIYALSPKAHFHQVKSKFAKYVKRTLVLYLLFALASIYGNLSGSLFLARILTQTIIISSAAAATLYLSYLILKSLLSFFIISKTGLSFNIIRLNGKKIKQKTLTYLQWFIALLWLRVFLKLLGVYIFLHDAVIQFLAIGWNFGDVYLSVGQVINFILILIVFSFIANILRALLEIEILPRFNLRKGVPMAAGLITRYFVLLLGFLMAVAAAGISLDQLGFMVGALSVGIGFGLQNVVGNFVSGLILIFERPVRVGDVVTASNVEGTITEIGIRASKIKDYQGAEIIVPNGDLISTKVTNWTLTDSKRRCEIIIRVEYGTNPSQVIEVIQHILAQHNGILKLPAASVLFLGFKDYSLDFRVLFWVEENILETTSEINLSIHDELKNLGIEIPVLKQKWIKDKDLDNAKTNSNDSEFDSKKEE